MSKTSQYVTRAASRASHTSTPIATKIAGQKLNIPPRFVALHEDWAQVQSAKGADASVSSYHDFLHRNNFVAYSAMKERMVGFATEKRDVFQSASGVYPGPTDSVLAMAHILDNARMPENPHNVMFGGTWFDAITQAGFNPFGALTKISAAMPKGLPIGFLTRGDVGLGRQRLDPKTIYNMYETLLDASHNEVPLFNRMFNAQNLHDSMTDSVAAIQRLRYDHGAKIDLSTEVSYKQGMPMEDIISYLVKGAKYSSGSIGVKDYAGVLTPEEGVKIYRVLDSALQEEAVRLRLHSMVPEAHGDLQTAMMERLMATKLDTTRIEFHCHRTQKTQNCDKDGNRYGLSTYEAIAEAVLETGRPVVFHTAPKTDYLTHLTLSERLMATMESVNGSPLNRGALAAADTAAARAFERNAAIMLTKPKEIPIGDGTAGGGEKQRLTFGADITRETNVQHAKQGIPAISEAEGLERYNTALVTWMRDTFADWQGVTPNYSIAMQLVHKREIAKIKGQDPLSIHITPMEMEGLRSVDPTRANTEGQAILEKAYQTHLGKALQEQGLTSQTLEALARVPLSVKDQGLDKKQLNAVLDTANAAGEKIAPSLRQKVMEESAWHEGKVKAVDTYGPAERRLDFIKSEVQFLGSDHTPHTAPHGIKNEKQAVAIMAVSGSGLGSLGEGVLRHTLSHPAAQTTKQEVYPGIPDGLSVAQWQERVKTSSTAAMQALTKHSDDALITRRMSQGMAASDVSPEARAMLGEVFESALVQTHNVIDGLVSKQAETIAHAQLATQKAEMEAWFSTMRSYGGATMHDQAAFDARAEEQRNIALGARTEAAQILKDAKVPDAGTLLGERTHSSTLPVVRIAFEQIINAHKERIQQEQAGEKARSFVTTVANSKGGFAIAA